MNRSRELFRARPWLAPTAAALAMAASLLIPFSYQKTTGYDVAVALDLADGAKTQSIAKHLTDDFGATSVSINSTGAGYLVTGRVPTEKASGLKGRADALSGVLTAQGMEATVSVEPVIEVVSGNLYAMTRDAVIRVDVTATGRTPAEIEADVQRQLQAAGLNDAEVTVTQADGQTMIQIFSHAEGAAGGTGGDGATILPDGGGWVSSSDAAAEHRDFEFTIDGKTPGTDGVARVRIEPGAAPRTDAELEAELERQLEAQGVRADVVVVNGKVQSVRKLDR